MSSHRSGDFKVKNKPFKGRQGHKSKGAVKRMNDGKTEKASVKSKTADQVKQSRRAKKMQTLKNQRESERNLRRQGGFPRLVVIISFSESSSSQELKTKLVNYCGALLDGVGPITVNPPNMKKQKFTFIAVNDKDQLDILEACLVADIIIPVVDALEGVSENGKKVCVFFFIILFAFLMVSSKSWLH